MGLKICYIFVFGLSEGVYLSIENIWFWWWEVNIFGYDFLFVIMLKYKSNKF